VIPILDKEVFFAELKKCSRIVNDALFTEKYLERFQPEDIKKASTLYIEAGGKRLRPAILLWCCGAVGGDLKKCTPAACAVEIFHTWTLVHDDIIDRDSLRRGKKTVHEYFKDALIDRTSDIKHEEAAHYGTSIAILAGDVQHGWNVSMLTELSTRLGVNPSITLELIKELNTHTINELIEGELLDLQYSCLKPGEVTADQIEEMLWKKTGILYQYCAYAGALLGTMDLKDESGYISLLSDFAGKCGVAFQLQDDILGVCGDPKVTGKPVGNDIREGKQTTILYHAWENSSEADKDQISATLGHKDASEKDVKKVIDIFINSGAIEETQARAKHIIESKMDKLETLPDSNYRSLLKTWANYMIKREL